MARILSIAETIAYLLSDKLLVESPRTIETLRLNAWKHKIYIARQPIELEQCLERKNIMSRQYDLGYIGRLSLEKGIDTFLKIIIEVLRILKHRKPRIVIVGGGDLESLVNKVSVRINKAFGYEIITYHGWTPHEKVLGILNNTKIVIIPSRAEGIPNVLLEAMLCGTIPIVFDVGGVRDLMRDGLTGFLLNSDTGSAIKILNVINMNVHSLEKMSMIIYKYVRTIYSKERIKRLWN